MLFSLTKFREGTAFDGTTTQKNRKKKSGKSLPILAAAGFELLSWFLPVREGEVPRCRQVKRAKCMNGRDRQQSRGGNSKQRCTVEAM